MTKIPGPGFGYTDYFDQAIDQKSRESELNYFPLRPSSSGDCAKKLGYKLAEHYDLIDIDNEIKSPSVTRLLDLGHYVEMAVIKQFYSTQKEIQVRYKQQTVTLFKLQKGPIIEGKVDLVLWSDKYKCVMDVKSAKDKFSAFYQSKWDETLEKLNKSKYTQNIGNSESDFYITDIHKFMEEYNDPFLNDNLIQVNAYGSSPFFKERGVDHCSILKYNKNDSRWYELRFRPNDKLLQKVKDNFNTVYNEVEKAKKNIKSINSKVDQVIKDNVDFDEHDRDNLKGKLITAKIPRSYQLGNIKCSFCPYNKSCWGRDSNQVKKEYFKTMPPKKWPKDTSRLKNYKKIEKLFKDYIKTKNHIDNAKKIETKLVTLLEQEKTNKVKLDNGDVYMIKLLKDGPVIRRTKL